MFDYTEIKTIEITDNPEGSERYGEPYVDLEVTLQDGTSVVDCYPKPRHRIDVSDYLFDLLEICCSREDFS